MNLISHRVLTISEIFLLIFYLGFLSCSKNTSNPKKLFLLDDLSKHYESSENPKKDCPPVKYPIGQERCLSGWTSADRKLQSIYQWVVCFKGCIKKLNCYSFENSGPIHDITGRSCVWNSTALSAFPNRINCCHCPGVHNESYWKKVCENLINMRNKVINFSLFSKRVYRLASPWEGCSKKGYSTEIGPGTEQVLLYFFAERFGVKDMKSLFDLLESVVKGLKEEKVRYGECDYLISFLVQATTKHFAGVRNCQVDEIKELVEKIYKVAGTRFYFSVSTWNDSLDNRGKLAAAIGVGGFCETGILGFMPGVGPALAIGTGLATIGGVIASVAIHTRIDVWEGRIKYAEDSDSNASWDYKDNYKEFIHLFAEPLGLSFPINVFDYNQKHGRFLRYLLHVFNWDKKSGGDMSGYLDDWLSLKALENAP